MTFTPRATRPPFTPRAVEGRASRFPLALAAGALVAGCYSAWPVVGPYACSSDACAEGLTCDDGLCCRPGGSPACPTLALDGGSCGNGGAPATWFEDLDGDGYGNPLAGKLLCAKPVLTPWADNALDCDDSAAEASPKGVEKCDGLDNNCNGIIDEGLTPVKTYFRDEDGDTYGNPAVSLSACAAPKGYVESNSDCAPNDLNVHPNAAELCNGVDEDCDTVKDDAPTDVGLDCADAGRGECYDGRTACVAAAKVCQSKKVPSADICDTLDNNCNGQADEQPDCGGPPSFFGAGVVGGAQTMNQSLSGTDLTSGCHKDFPGAGGEAWSAPSWTGSGGADHILYFENASGFWDLSRAGLKLHLAASWTMTGPLTPPWQPSSQPVVFVCSGPGGQLSFNRYVRTAPDGGTRYPDGGVFNLVDKAGGSFDETIPLAAGNLWVLGNGSGADLTKVKRVELIVRPTGIVNSATPAFTFTVNGSSGFVP